jgi:hypothetical protein
MTLVSSLPTIIDSKLLLHFLPICEAKLIGNEVGFEFEINTTKFKIEKIS